MREAADAEDPIGALIDASPGSAGNAGSTPIASTGNDRSGFGSNPDHQPMAARATPSSTSLDQLALPVRP